MKTLPDTLHNNTARLEPTQMEVGTGEPGYRWTEAVFVISPDGKKLYPPFLKREAIAFCKKQGWAIGE